MKRMTDGKEESPAMEKTSKELCEDHFKESYFQYILILVKKNLLSNVFLLQSYQKNKLCKCDSNF